MLNQERTMGPVDLYRAAAGRALAVVEGVRADQLGLPTPCDEWGVQALVDHIVAGSAYLLAAMDGATPEGVAGATAEDYRKRLDAVEAAAADPAALARTCTSPLGFEWTAGEAFAGTFMDTLIHTWDLATATGQDASLDPDLVATCSALFLPDMPERGRAAGIIGPAVAVGPDASAQDRLLAAMGRHP
jgi:uncharacterized protein (TIGR03086 family)